MISNEKKDCIWHWQESSSETISPRSSVSSEGLYKLTGLDNLIHSGGTTQFVIVYDVALLDQQELFFSTLEKINKMRKIQNAPLPIVIFIGDNPKLSFNGSDRDCVVKTTLQHCDQSIFNAMMEKEASECFSYSRQLHEFDTQLKIISTKAVELRTSGYVTAADAANKLHENLKNYAQTYFDNPTKEAHAIFKKLAKKELDIAHEVLDKHRGWKQILGNVALAILGLGIFYLIAVAVNRNIFFNKTDSSKKLDNFEKFIDNCRAPERVN